MVVATAFQPPLSQHSSRVVQISGATMGSAFYIDIDSKQYLVTANHVVGDNLSALKLKSRDKWIPFPCVMLANDPRWDIAVLKMPILFNSINIPVNLSMEGILWGQPVWFLGFPFGDGLNTPLHAEGMLPMPFVKWAFLSSFGDEAAKHRLVLDGMNNVGFSGGPVGFTSMTGEQKFGGMIVGYKEETSFVEKFLSEDLRDSHIYKTNAGLIYAVSASKILEVISSCPNGMPN